VKVLFISSGTGKQGISPLVKNQGESLKRAGIKIDFYTIKKGGLKGYIQAAFDLRKKLKQNPYSILHAHYGLSGLTGLLGRRSHPLVISFMGDDLMGSNRANGKVKKRSLLFARFNAILSRYLYDYTIVKSAAMAQKVKGKKVDIIPNGVDLNTFFPMEQKEVRKKLGLELEKTYILFLSDPARPEKNYPLAQQAMEKIQNENIQLVPVYNKNREEVVLWLNAAEVLVLTSYHEGSPNAIKEAMACNCPVVTTRVGDVEKVTANTEGCYLTSFDTNDFAGKLEQAIRFSKTSGRTNGRKQIMELGLDAKTTAEKIKAVYREVLENRKKRR